MPERLRNIGMHFGRQIGAGIESIRSGIIGFQETRRLQ